MKWNRILFLQKKAKLKIKESPETENGKETSVPDKSQFLTPLLSLSLSVCG
jgi:hypothetical protein